MEVRFQTLITQQKLLQNQSNHNNVLYVVLYYPSDDIIDFSYQ